MKDLRDQHDLTVLDVTGNARRASRCGPCRTTDPTVALCLGIYGDPTGMGVSYQRGTPVEEFPAGVGSMQTMKHKRFSLGRHCAAGELVARPAMPHDTPLQAYQLLHINEPHSRLINSFM
jgi:hypothetical protein